MIIDDQIKAIGDIIMEAKTFAIFIAGIIFLVVIELVRRQKMTFKYSLSWLSACLLVLFFAINDGLLDKLSTLSGFQLPSNFIFFLLLTFFVFLSLLLTIYVNEQNNRCETLAQAVGILEHKVNQIMKDKDISTDTSP